MTHSLHTSLVLATLLLAGCSTQQREPSSLTPQSVALATKSSPDKLVTTDPKSQPNELGLVRWIRDFEMGQKIAKSQGKPMFVLFTEVPGCSTVNKFATNVLRHPLVVEAIESEFVPVVVYNNIKGKDRETLTAFKEPTWNNPVVRIMSHDKKPLAARFAGPYRVGGLTKVMLQGLNASGNMAPQYIRLVHQEHSVRDAGADSAVFPMYCFWSGEVKLGAMDGVVDTSPGFAQGREVVQVEFDPRQTSSHVLSKQFGAAAMAKGVPVRRSSKDDKHQLQHSTLRFVPMTPMQAMRVNAALGTKRSPSPFLSPRQLQMHQTIQKAPKHSWPRATHQQPIATSWNNTMAAIKSYKP